jgi:hypothetical protein
MAVRFERAQAPLDYLTVGTLTDLKALAVRPSSPQQVVMHGRSTAGDGAGGTFIWRSGDQSANVTADPGEGVWVAPDSATTGASGAWQRLYDGPVNVRWWGAVGDEVTDDTTAIQNAIDYAWDASLHDVYFPGGTYLVTGLRVYSGTTYRGVSPVETIIKSNTDAGIVVSANWDGHNGVNSPTGLMVIRDLRILGSNNSAHTSQVGVLVRDYYSKIMNVWVANSGSHGVEFTHLNSSSVSVSGTLVENHILNVELFNNNGYGLKFGSSGNAKLTDAHMHNLIVKASATSDYGIFVGSGAGLYLDGVHVYSVPVVDGIRVDNGFNTNISNIYVEAATAAGINLAVIQKHVNLTNLNVAGAEGVRAGGGASGSNVTVQISNMAYGGAGTAIAQVAGTTAAHVYAVNVTKSDSGAAWKSGSNVRIINDLSYEDGESRVWFDNRGFSLPVAHNSSVNTGGAVSFDIPIRLSGTFQGLSGMLNIGLRAFHNGALRATYAGMITVIQKDTADAPAIHLGNILLTGVEFTTAPAIAISAGTGPGDYTLTVSFEAASADARGVLSFVYTPS